MEQTWRMFACLEEDNSVARRMDARSTLALSHPNNSLQGKRKPCDCASATRMDAGTSIALSAQAREDFHEPTGVGNRDYHLAIVRTPSPDDEFFAIHDGCVRRAASTDSIRTKPSLDLVYAHALACAVDPLCLVLPGLWKAGTWHTRASAARRSPPYGLIATPVQTNPSSAVKPFDR
jgi:hypothetical protein